MRKIELLIVVLLLAFEASAKDTIVLRNGDVLESVVVEITQTEVKYKKASRLNGPTYSINKNEVLAINYEDGEKETFEVADASAHDVVAKEQSASIVKLDPDTIRKFNDDLIEKFKTPYTITGLPELKETKDAFVRYFPTKDSNFYDGNLLITYIPTYMRENKGVYHHDKDGFDTHPAIGLLIQNLTESTIFIDLGTSFFTVNGKSSPYYTPSATSSTVTNSTGASINMGSVASAFGVEGSVGKIASGLNLGGSKSNSTTTLTFTQRVVAIAPKGYITLSDTPLPKMFNAHRGFLEALEIIIPKNGVFKHGSKIELSEPATPSFGANVTYSFEENFENSASISSSFYLGEIFGIHFKGLKPDPQAFINNGNERENNLSITYYGRIKKDKNYTFPQEKIIHQE